MRAAVLREIGGETLEIVDDVTLGELGPTDVKVDIRATGVCHSDLHAMKGDLPQGAPFVPGHEGAGVVSEVGSAVTRLSVGDHVVVAWSPPCGQCVACVDQKSPHLCIMIQFAIAGVPRFKEGGTDLFGMAGTGTFAEQLIVPQEAAIKIDDDVPFEIASLIGCGVTTGVGAAINTAKVEPGSTCVVFGCGGVGISVIQGCRVAGAAVIVAVDLNDDKLEMAKRFGATHSVKPDGLDALKGEVTGMAGGFDYAFEAIGLPQTVRAAYDAVRRGGTAIVVGVGNMSQTVEFNMFELFFQEKTLKGSYYGSADVRSDFNRFLRLWKAGKLDLEGMISQRITLDDVNDAIQKMKRGEVIRSVIEL
ncbi:Zn-dependent alcohol dehydrogenase [Rhabdothermincola sp.]|uniref:Zn-dependent alcohol dehydrogenase n=1 Tax=Rhabdothermincola sp. TaxID=2820405 RepID=UPI002FDF6ECE